MRQDINLLLAIGKTMARIQNASLANSRMPPPSGESLDRQFRGVFHNGPVTGSDQVNRASRNPFPLALFPRSGVFYRSRQYSE